jgi:diguanylate cyclase (GGDEF)-like protein
MKIRVNIAMLDVDNFKKVNDNFGHDQGDAVLMRIGSLLKGTRSRNIRCYRYGGEEFVMLFRNFDKGTVLRIADSFRMDISWQTWDFPGIITVSIGVAEGRANKDTVRLADENMYYSKTHGKDAVTYDINGEKVIMQMGDAPTDAKGLSRS